MILLFTSDTHNEHRSVQSPECDIIVHSGDVSLRGSELELHSFLYWYKDYPAKHKILIPGNHDFLFEELYKAGKLEEFCEPFGIHVLHNRTLTLEGISFYGTADQPWFRNWAFNRTSEQLKKSYSEIPKVDILVTHTPPYGIMDRAYRYQGYDRVGSKELLECVSKLKPAIHSFGHIHEDAGFYSDSDTLFINASYKDKPGRTVNPNQPKWVRWNGKVHSYGFLTEGGVPPLPGVNTKENT